MKMKVKDHTLMIAAAVICAVPQATLAADAIVQTPSPVIHLKDNLDEEANLGWCSVEVLQIGYTPILVNHKVATCSFALISRLARLPL
ncbi:MAG: hypothetical protein HKO04_06020 [Silicimonas sp.]|nr:hypothetical protein [Silicimonas sp.]